MTTEPGRTALIVGAGIGGLAAALAVRSAGWNVRVFERAQNPRELGFALLLAPNAMLALGTLGLADAVASGGVIAERGEIRRANGEILRRLNVADIGAVLGAPTVCVLRPVLHGLLLEAVGSDALALSSEAVGVRDVGKTVALTLADGLTVTGDVLIGADGVRSTVRRLLHPAEPPPRPSGLFALRGVAFDVAHHLGDLSGLQYFGRGLEAGLARASERAVYWYLSIRAEDVAHFGGDAESLAQRLSAAFDETFRAIVGKTARDDLRLDELFEREPLPFWGSDTVTLLGDAAHPMLPHAGQGAAQALEDAVALGRALRVGASVPDALHRYERKRAPRAQAIVASARRNARVASIHNEVGCWLRDVAIRLVPESVVARSIVAVARPPKD